MRIHLIGHVFRLRYLPVILSCFLSAHAISATPAQLVADEDWAAALGAWMRILASKPDDAAARKGAWEAAMRLGLFDQAAALHADLSPADQAAMAGDRVALAIRHGRIDVRTLIGNKRYLRLDAALAETDVLAAEFLAGEAAEGESRRRLIDRVSALVARNRPRDAVTLYEALQGRGVIVPAWALGEVAGAYLALRQPFAAEALYRQVLATSPDDFDANLGLFYALVETEQMDLATAHIDQYADRLPARRHRDGQPNGERWSAEVASDQARLYANRYDQAALRIDQRTDETPFNAEVRSAEASLHLARGWPRQGEADLRRNIGQDPRNPSLHADRAEVLLSLQRWDSAHDALNQAQSIALENARVRQASETFSLHDRAELYIEAGYGRSNNAAPLGSTDWSVDSWLYSKPIADRWRIFTHSFNASADYENATRWVRTGLGAEWRDGDWRVTGEANGGEGEKTGLLGTVRWQPNDYWKFYANAETVTNDIPLQAVRAGVTANRGAVGLDWQANESRRLGVSASATDFSDGNLRHRLGATWFERWYSGPSWLVETTLGADASHNSTGYQAAYFNPPDDRSGWLGASFEQMVWREYDHSFRHRLTLSLGTYWQSDFGSDSTEAIEYQHRWELGRALSLRYGVGRSLRPYDGVREARNFGSLMLLWRF